MSVQLPIRQEGPHFRFVTELDGVAFSFEFRWNDRESAWFMTIGDGEGTPIVAGVRVISSFPLLTRFTDERLPAGFLYAIDSQARDADPDFEGLGRRVQLVYFTRAELA